MARTNKYTSLNFNDIYDKKPTTTTTTNNHRSPSSSNKTVISNSRIHGNMLVLTRPSPKPIAPISQPSITPQPHDPLPIEPDSISLRPLGRTGSPSPSLLPSPSPSTLQLPLTNLTVSVSPKTNKFVPPHLRPGFHGKEEKPEPEAVQEQQTGFVNRPQSGGGYERNRGGFEVMDRPRSSGSNRPFSSG